MKNFSVVSHLKNLRVTSPNPRRDWLLVLLGSFIIYMVVMGLVAMDYYNLYQAGNLETVDSELSKQSQINEKSLQQALDVINSRAERFSELDTASPKVIDPSL